MWNEFGVPEGVASGPSFPFFPQGQGKRSLKAAPLFDCMWERLGVLC